MNFEVIVLCLEVYFCKNQIEKQRVKGDEYVT